MDTKQLNENCMMQTACPFTSPTEEATGEWFVGRQNVLKKMTKEIVQGGRVCNYHIVGLPRIGKSSLLKAFQKSLLDSQLCQNLVVVYISLDGYGNAEEMWRTIGKSLDRNIRKLLDKTKQHEYAEELEYECVDMTNIDYDCVCSIAKSMKNLGIIGLIMIDEFDNFSSFAKKSTVGQLRTLFSAAEFGTRAILASRRTIERIESEVSGSIDSDVSTLSPIFINGCHLTGFNKDDMDDYWSAAAKRVGEEEISSSYKKNVEYYVGNHPCLLNLLNVNYWMEQTSHKYLCEETTEDIKLGEAIVYAINNAFELAVWRDLEKWGLLRPLIILTWGPDIKITNKELSVLEKYGIIDSKQRLTETGKDSPIRIAVSRYFTDWMCLKRYCLPFGDEWSMAEKNMRSIVKFYCKEVYQGDEEKMIMHLGKKYANSEGKTIPESYTTKGRFEAMKKRKEQNIRKYPDMSSFIIDYSDPSDLPTIFFTKEWDWFEHVFHGTLEDWKEKFKVVNEIRNYHSHNNDGVPKRIVENASRYCREINERIERFLDNGK